MSSTLTVQIAREQKPENSIHVMWRAEMSSLTSDSLASTPLASTSLVFPRLSGGWKRLVAEDKLIKIDTRDNKPSIVTLRASFFGDATYKLQVEKEIQAFMREQIKLRNIRWYTTSYELDSHPLAQPSLLSKL